MLDLGHNQLTAVPDHLADLDGLTRISHQMWMDALERVMGACFYCAGQGPRVAVDFFSVNSGPG
jgi:hypothetical protein